MNPVEQHLHNKLQERKELGNLRRLTTKHSPVDFYSNDYLGLVTTGILKNSLLNIPDKDLTTGSTGSRLLSGNSEATEILEKQIAAFHHAEAALLFNSGYDANIGLLASIANRHTTILYDELCHASIIDGIRLSQAGNHYKFRHNDLDDLKDKLNKTKGKGPQIVVVESVYSMDGDIAPLAEISSFVNDCDASLIVDEAHATGIFGTKGEGVVCNLGLQEKVFARVHTFGKALGCHGAAVVGNDMLKQYLINFARSFIYTTALPGHAVQSTTAAYNYLSSPTFSNKTIHDLIIHFREGKKKATAFTWKDSISPIQALVIGDNSKASTAATSLQRAGFQVNPILHPTVPLGAERLRICLHAFNTTDQIDQLIDVLNADNK
ncbi:MAG TPA: 8-amino-7-oxononanoate synthase [Flavipsychrobacter sp.]|nr:8-amino-7-oxononanoate synthase [Flavipsychrobacter sp.]